MELTNEQLAKKILQYLNKIISVDEFASWAEAQMIENNYEETYFDEISEILSKIGVINVKGFELPIAFYLNSLKELNYQTIFNVKPKRKKKESSHIFNIITNNY